MTRYLNSLAGMLATFVLLNTALVASAERLEPGPRIGLAGSDLDACPSLGQVTGLNPRGDNYPTVRATPNADGRSKDRLGPGRMVFLCDRAGEWLGVVYSPNPKDQPGDCRVGSPVPSVRPYSGPCRWGWVHSRYVRVIAG